MFQPFRIDVVFIYNEFISVWTNALVNCCLYFFLLGTCILKKTFASIQISKTGFFFNLHLKYGGACCFLALGQVYARKVESRAACHTYPILRPAKVIVFCFLFQNKGMGMPPKRWQYNHEYGYIVRDQLSGVNLF